MREEYVLKKIKDILDERGWTLYRLAKEADISYSTLSNTFQRNNVPSIPTLIRVCDGLGITLAEFFDEESTTVKQLTIADQHLIMDFHRLPREDKKLLSAYMQGLMKSVAAYDVEEPEPFQEDAEDVTDSD